MTDIFSSFLTKSHERVRCLVYDDLCSFIMVLKGVYNKNDIRFINYAYTHIHINISSIMGTRKVFYYGQYRST